MPTNPISAAEAGKIQPHETADAHIERELLSAENARLRDELRRAESALRTAGRLLQPYLKARG